MVTFVKKIVLTPIFSVCVMSLIAPLDTRFTYVGASSLAGVKHYKFPHRHYMDRNFNIYTEPGASLAIKKGEPKSGVDLIYNAYRREQLPILLWDDFIINSITPNPNNNVSPLSLEQLNDVLCEMREKYGVWGVCLSQRVTDAGAVEAIAKALNPEKIFHIKMLPLAGPMHRASLKLLHRPATTEMHFLHVIEDNDNGRLRYMQQILKSARHKNEMKKLA